MAESESRILAENQTLERSRELLSTLMPLDGPIKDALALCRTELIHEFVRATYREFKNNPHTLRSMERFLDRVVKSERSTNQWLEQILTIYRWLDKEGRNAKFDDIIEYASCAWHGGDVGGVQQYLDSCGFERSASNLRT